MTCILLIDFWGQGRLCWGKQLKAIIGCQLSRLTDQAITMSDQADGVWRRRGVKGPFAVLAAFRARGEPQGRGVPCRGLGHTRRGGAASRGLTGPP